MFSTLWRVKGNGWLLTTGANLGVRFTKVSVIESHRLRAVPFFSSRLACEQALLGRSGGRAKKAPFSSQPPYPQEPQESLLAGYSWVTVDREHAFEASDETAGNQDGSPSEVIFPFPRPNLSSFLPSRRVALRKKRTTTRGLKGSKKVTDRDQPQVTVLRRCRLRQSPLEIRSSCMCHKETMTVNDLFFGALTG